MREPPQAPKLLRVARQHLLADVLPNVAEAARYDLLMVAAAMDIAAREAEAGDASLRSEFEGLAIFLDKTCTGVGSEDPESQISALSRQVAQGIRAGKWDGHPALHKLLLDIADADLTEANPKYLKPPRT